MAFIKTFCISIFHCFRKISLKLISLFMISMALLAVGIVSLPVILDQPLIQKKLAAGLVDWSGGNLSFDGAIALSYFPQLSLKAEHVFLRDIRRLPHIDKMRARSVTAKFRWWPLLLGNLDVGELSLEKPEIYLLVQTDVGTDDKANIKEGNDDRIKRIFKTIRNIPFTDITLRDALMVVPNKGETGRKLYKFSASLSKEDDIGNFSGRMQVVLNDREVFLSGFSSVTKVSLGKNIIPLNLRVVNPLFQTKISGKFKVGQSEDHSFQGVVDIKDVKVTEFSHWVGMPLKGNKAFSKASIAGNFQWQEQRIDFSDAHIGFGEHKSDGKLSLAYGGKRPVLEGNLSFASLDLTRGEKNILPHRELFLDKVSDTKVTVPTPDKNLTDYLDIDLRLFVDSVLLGDTELHSAVATLLVNEGNVNLQLADAKVFGGKAYGQFLVRVDQTTPLLTVKLSLKNIQPEKMIILLTQDVLLEGRVNIEMDLVSLGSGNKALLQNLNGKVMINSASSGYVGLDLGKIFNNGYGAGVTQIGLKKKWQDIRSGKTGFNQLSALFMLANGQMTNRVLINENGYVLSIQGQADLVTKRIKWLFDRKMARNAMHSARYGIAATRRVVTLVEGGLDNPAIWHRYIGINAAPADMNIFPPQPILSQPAMMPVRMRSN